VDEFEFEVGYFLKGELSVLPDELQIPRKGGGED
jgi:hypothetical protein